MKELKKNNSQNGVLRQLDFKIVFRITLHNWTKNVY